MSRLRIKLGGEHLELLELLAARYDLPEATIAKIILTDGLDDWAEKLGQDCPRWAEKGSKGVDSAHGGQKRGQKGSILPTVGSEATDRDPDETPKSPRWAEKGSKGVDSAHGGQGMDLAPKILESRERESDLNPHSQSVGVAELTAELVELLNSKGGTSHSPHDPASQRAVFQRFKGEGCEPATIEQMRAVVSAKAEAWNGTKYAAGLTLLTLLGDRFGQYLGTLTTKTTGGKGAPTGGAFDYLGGDQ